jgi:hypothetical protein
MKRCLGDFAKSKKCGVSRKRKGSINQKGGFICPSRLEKHAFGALKRGGLLIFDEQGRSRVVSLGLDCDAFREILKEDELY